MKKSFVSLLLTFTVACCCFLSACIFNGNSKSITASGKIYLNSAPLEDVVLKSQTKTLTTSNQNGEFEITINSSTVTIYPEKAGYEFFPKSITITEDTSDLIFVAETVKPLNGTLSLSQVIITPTSISNFGDNFSYTQDGYSYLKINKFRVDINGNSSNVINQNYNAIKNQSNAVVVYDDISVDTGTEFLIKFSLDACFVMGNTEYVYAEEKISVLEVKEKQYTNNLNSKNQIEYTAVGINSSNNKYTYNVTFVFDYYKNI